MSKYLVPQKGEKVAFISFLLIPLAMLVIYSVVIPIVVLDIWVQVYNTVYFRIMKIPRIDRKEYIIIDRYELKQLTFSQLINCIYCGYVNGVLSWMKAVANQTEIYSCAIKHKRKRSGQEHHDNFYEFEDYK